MDFFHANYVGVDDLLLEQKPSTSGINSTHHSIKTPTQLIDKLIPPTDIANKLGNTLEMIYRVFAHSFRKIGNKTVIAFGKRLKNIA